MDIKKKIMTALCLYFILTSLSAHAAMGRKYSEIQLSPDMFVISIEATDTTSSHKALSGLLTRAAEVTLRNGYKYFTVTRSEDQSETKNTAYFGSAIVSQKSSKIPHGQMTIRCSVEPSKGSDYIDAEFFLKNKKK